MHEDSVTTYQNDLMRIKRSCNHNIAFINEVIKRIGVFVQSNQKFLSDLKKINFDFPCKRETSMNPFTSSFYSQVKGPKQFPDSELKLKQEMEGIAAKVFKDPPGLSIELEFLSSDFAMRLDEVKNDYSKQVKMMVGEAEAAEGRRKDVESEFAREEEKRQGLVSKINSLQSKESPDENVVNKIIALKTELQSQEMKMSKMISNFNDVRTIYGSAMEKFLSTFEKIDEKLNVAINEVFVDFSMMISNTKSKKEAAVQYLSELGNPDEYNKDVQVIVDKYSGDQIVPALASVKVNPLSFNISSILLGEAFKNEVTKQIAIAVSDFDCRGIDEMNLKKDESVLIHQTSEGRCLVEHSEIAGFVDASCLTIPESDMAPCISPIKNEVYVPPLLAKGSTVLLRREEEGFCHIVTQEYDELLIPRKII